MAKSSNNSSVLFARSIYVAALRFCILGFRVFPLFAGKKRPSVATGFKAASNDPEKIERWFGKKEKNFNLGVATGKVSGIWVLDVDVKNNAQGMQSLAELEAEFGKLPETLSCTTASGGKHYYFKYDSSPVIKSSVGVRPGIDVRGEGGYVVAPPSIVDSGHYTWDDPNATIAKADQWLVDLVTRPVKKPRQISAEKSGEMVVVNEGSRNQTVFKFASGQMHKGRSKDIVLDISHEFNQTSCQPPLPDAEVVQIVENAFRLYENTGRLHLTDKGNAEKMAEHYRGRVRYVPQMGQWLEWNGNLWARIDEMRVYSLARAISGIWHAEAAAEQDHVRQKALRKHAFRLESLTQIDNMVKLMRSEEGVTTSAHLLDQQEMILPVKNGMVDLTTGELLPADPTRLVTHGTDVIYDQNAQCPRWLSFLSDIMNEDHELIAYLQRAIGYSLTTSTAEHVMFFMYGHGANGKSTFLNVVRALLGDLGTQAAGESLLEGTRSGSGPSGDIARLHGKRLVAISEIDEGKHLAEARVKSITGGDAVVARFLYKDEFVFVPQAKFWTATNHQPVIKGNDNGIWRRIQLIPFLVKFRSQQQDKSLEKKLLAELPGILRWAVEGCMQWSKGGLQTPGIIVNATNEYRSQMDIFGTWESDCCLVGNEYDVKFSEAYDSFKEWTLDNQSISYNKNRFGRMMSERGYVKETRPDRYYVGMALRNNVSLEEVTKYDKRRKEAKEIISTIFTPREDAGECSEE